MKYIQRFLLTVIMAIAVLGAKADWLDGYTLNVGDTKELYVSDLMWRTLSYSTTHWGYTHWTTTNSSVVKITSMGKTKCDIEAVGIGEAKIEYDVYWADYYYNYSHTKDYYYIKVEGGKITITATPNGGAVPQGSKVTLSTSPSGANIYYTLDGTTPTYNSKAYTSSGITMNNDCTLKAIAMKSGYTNSDILTAKYTVEPPEGSKITISASPNGGTVTKGTKVTLSSSPSSANIYYTLDGSTPTSSSKVYSSSGILLYDDCTLKAIAMKSGYVNSDVLTAQYLVEPAEGSKITISASPNGGNIPIGEKVTLSTSPRDAKIYYTLDGSTPTSSSKVYTSSGIAINNDCTLKAIAMKSGYTNSDVLTANYTVEITDNTVEGVEIAFKVTDVNAKTVEVSGCASYLVSRNVTIPSEVKGYKVTRIGNFAFSSRSYLPSVTIPESVTSIGSYAFSNCESLTYIAIPKSVTSIGNYAFEGCTSLTSITMYGIPDAVGTEAIPTTVTIYVPASIYDAAVAKFPNNMIRTLEEVANCYVMLTLADGTTLTDIFVDGVITSRKYYGREDIISAEINEGITSIGDDAFEGCTSLTSITIPESVTSIGNSAFSSCTSLTSITIPESVTSIGDYTFWECSGLTSVTIPESVTSIGSGAFYNCKSLTSITIPESVTSIGDSAFKGCKSLTSITIPESVTSIGDHTFWECSGLTSVTLPESVTSIGDWAFADCTSLFSITIPESVTSIGRSAFADCTSLTSITIPGAVTSIDDSTFSGCASLTSITIPESVTSIGSSAFGHCTSLTSITIPESVTSIRYWAFTGCTSLISITIPGAVTSIGFSAFQYCRSLTYITMYGIPEDVGTDAFPTTATIYVPKSIYGAAVAKFPNNKIRTLEEVVASRYVMLTLADGSTQTDIFVDKVITSKKYYGREDIVCAEIGEEITSIGDSAFEGCTSLTSITIPEPVTSIGNSAFEGCTSLTSITIPESVTSIGNSAFEGCTSLTSITIPESVTTIGNSVFEGCTSLTSITIPESVNSIGNSAFKGCTSLTSITIPESVTSIGNSAFKGCTSLTSITIPESVTSIGGSAFEGCTSLTSVTMYGIPESVGIDAIPTTATIYVPASIYNTAVAKFPNNVIMTLEEVAGYYVKLMLADGTTQTDIFEDGVIPNKKYYRREDIVSAEIGDGIISIGDETFFKCSGLTSVTIGNSVASIGKYAFNDCSSLTSVIIPNSVIEMGSSAFSGCYMLKDVYISTSLKRLESFTFGSCSALTKISGGDNIEYIDSSGIYRYGPWAENLPDGMNFIGKVLFKYQGEVPANTTINIPAGCTQIYCNNIYSSDAFADKDGLLGINIPASVTDIAEGAFKNCPNLQKITVDASNPVYDSRNNCNAVIEKATNTLTHGCSSTTIPTNVTSIGDYAFYGNWTKDEIIIPNQIVSIAYGAFRNNSNVKSILIGKGLRKLDWFAFAQLPHLKEIAVSTSNPYFDSRDNCNAIIEKATNTLVVGCSTTTIPNTVKTIGSCAFYGNGDEDFTSLIIPNSVEEIEEYAFDSLPYLRKVSIGANVKKFSYCIFYKCNSLEAIESLNGFPDDIDENVFNSGTDDFSIYDNVTLYVPAGCRNNYRLATGWSNFKNIVEGSLLVGVDDVLTPQPKEEVIFSPTGVRLSAPQRGVNIVNGKKLLVK